MTAFSRDPPRPGLSAAGMKGLDPEEAEQAFGEKHLGPLGIFFCLALCAGIAAVLDYGVLPPSYKPKTPAPMDVRARSMAASRWRLSSSGSL